MRFMQQRNLYLAVTIAAVSLLSGCRESIDPSAPRTAISTDEIAAHRTHWTQRALAAYEYDYRLTGFFIQFAGRNIHLVVRDGVVRSATDAATGEAMTGPLTQWPTIATLFDEVTQAADGGVLRAVRFDPVLEYPTEIDLDGPPDASGSVFATGLRPLP